MFDVNVDSAAISYWLRLVYYAHLDSLRVILGHRRLRSAHISISGNISRQTFTIQTVKNTAGKLVRVLRLGHF